MLMTTTGTGQDVVDLLLEQHDEIKSLFGQLRQARGEAKRELFEDLVRLLAVHETAEETVVHPAARRKIESGEEVVEQRLEEEDRAKKELADLYDLGVDSPEFDARLEKFAAEVIDHASKEESEEFLADYRRAIASTYPERSWGTVLPFRRIFAVAQRVGS